MNKINFNNFIKTQHTPFYVFDCEELLKRVNLITQKLPKNSLMCYAIKANPFLVPVLKDLDIFFEVCSPGELLICEKENIDPCKIVFSGVCKTFDDISRAYNLNVNTITLESIRHCELLLDVIRKSENKHSINVIIRLSCGNQFGMSTIDVESCINKIINNSFINIRGIHYFTGTQKKLSKIKKEVDFIIDYSSKLKSKFKLTFSDIEYGPGLSFDYFENNNYANNFDELIQFSDYIKNSDYNFVIELGRFVASSCGYYVTQIMDKKTDDTQNYLIIDGGINHINYYGQMMGMKIPPVYLQKKDYTISNNEKIDYIVCGSLCTTADVVIRRLLLDNPNIGDYLIFSNIGAYSITEGIYLFLSHPLPQVFMYKNDSFILVRKTIESYKINMK